MKALTTLQLDCILLICFRRNSGSELERHFEIKSITSEQVPRKTMKIHANGFSWSFSAFFAVYIYVRYVYMNEREMYVRQGRE